MKRHCVLAAIPIFFLSACFPQIHLDLLGTEEIREVVLVQSERKDKILLLDISGMISSTLDTGFLEKEGDILSQHPLVCDGVIGIPGDIEHPDSRS